MKYSGTSVHEPNSFYDFGKMATCVFVWERWPQSCSTPDAEFPNKTKLCQVLLLGKPNLFANKSVN